MTPDYEVERGCYLPTPEEIAAACAEIRAGWSPGEWAIRCASKDRRSTARVRIRRLRR